MFVFARIDNEWFMKPTIDVILVLNVVILVLNVLTHKQVNIWLKFPYLNDIMVDRIHVYFGLQFS